MFYDGRQIESGSRLEYDVCIIGGGPAGITLAHALKDSGKRVAIIESGDRYYDEDIQSLYNGINVNPVFPDPSISRVRALGGASNHWGGSCNEFDEIDFSHRSWINNSGWPITKAELQPYYGRAKTYCEIPNESFSAEYWASKTDLKLFPSNQNVRSSMSFRSPPTNFGEVWANQFESSQLISVFLFSNAHIVDFDEKKQKIRSLEVKSWGGSSFHIDADIFVLAMGGIENARMLLHWNNQNENRLGNQHGLVGRYFMDHPTVKSAFLLPTVGQHSFDFYRPLKYGKSQFFGFLQFSDQALRQNEITNMKLAMIPADHYFLSEAIISAHSISHSAKQLKLPRYLFRHMRNIFADFDMLLEAASRSYRGEHLFDYSDDFAGYFFDAMMEQEPNPDSRITLSQSRTDRLGVPEVEIDWRLTSADKDRVWKAMDVLANYFGETAIGRLRTRRHQPVHVWELQMGFGSHHMGTTRMAGSERSGVVDADMKVFGTDNVFMAGSSVFPTSSHVPPTLTIVALSLRLAERLKTVMEG